ncbi:hypothetical protein [Flavobacterium selenitireducens]|uniref:hypothetical protein n=1 Tax=Flavobacterium selenitireducens TaxID=2722704 RepID=UPI00168B7296|nr:hypothetical protein [Flavobacterium selenitireducens]MBD3581611.1 hypothetical protein [Flavobacterium selenitireducens]
MTNNTKRWRPLIEIFVISCLAALLHFLILKLFSIDTTAFVYGLVELYVYFLAASLAIVTALVVIEKRNKDQVGYTFLILTSVKMVGAYLLLRPVLEQGIKAEKINFFVVFALFLAFETIVSGRMLNRE